MFRRVWYFVATPSQLVRKRYLSFRPNWILLMILQKAEWEEMERMNWQEAEWEETEQMTWQEAEWEEMVQTTWQEADLEADRTAW